MGAFVKSDRREIPKTVRLSEKQLAILDRLVKLRARATRRSCCATDVILYALEEYTRAVLDETDDRQLRKLVEGVDGRCLVT
jgi:hypothetical protein